MNECEALPGKLQEARIRSGKTQSGAARLLGCTAQAISNWERGYTRIDCISLFRLLDWYGADIYDFFESCGLASRLDGSSDSDEAQLLSLYRSLPPQERGKLRRIAQVLSGQEEQEEKAPAERIIPLFHYLAAAGIPSPQPGEDYDEHTVDSGSRADFAVRISGDSMEPYIPDGSIVYCERSVDLADGDVGIFYARDGMVCKQFLRDSEGNVYLFSLNRQRRNADLLFPHSSGLALMCYGRVLLDRRIPLPED